MKKLARFVREVMRSLWKDVSLIEAATGIAFLFVAIFIIAFPPSISWLTPFWLRIIGVTIISALILKGAYSAWSKADSERENFKEQIENKKTKVELTVFNSELQLYPYSYRDKPAVLIQLKGTLKNTSNSTAGSLEYFAVEIFTDIRCYQAKSMELHKGDRLQPNHVVSYDFFNFIGELPSEYPDIETWIQHISGKEGKVVLRVQGQDTKEYPIKISDIENLNNTNSDSNNQTEP